MGWWRERRLLHDAIVYVDGVTVRKLFVFCDGEEREMQRLHHLLPLPLYGRSQETGSLRQWGPKAAARRATIPPCPPCAVQPMLLTRGLKVESFPAAPPPPRSLLPNHLHPPPRSPRPLLAFLKNWRVACSKKKKKKGTQNLFLDF